MSETSGTSGTAAIGSGLGRPARPRKVRYEELVPYEWAAIMPETPIVYWPLGLIEWHGEHLALGNDAVKAEALCVRIAERFGGIVYPPSYCRTSATSRRRASIRTSMAAMATLRSTRNSSG
jgi:hypothetical protein